MASFVVVTTFGPLVEELMKVSIALWIVEKRPYLFRYRVQILVATIAGGLAFSLIENAIYFHLYLDKPSVELILWRSTACVALHTTCSFIAGIGLVKIWKNCMKTRVRPDLRRGYLWMCVAIMGHGLYNGIVTIAEISGWLRF